MYILHIYYDVCTYILQIYYDVCTYYIYTMMHVVHVYYDACSIYIMMQVVYMYIYLIFRSQSGQPQMELQKTKLLKTVKLPYKA